MVLYLLGIPLAIASAKILHDDIKYTAMNLRIDNASHDVNVQYRQIEENFTDILNYSGANCDFKKISHGNYEIKNVQKGQYGGMERYLAEKGYYSQAIDYAKKLFDDIADKENEIKTNERNERIKKYERDLRFNETYYDIFKISRTEFTPQFVVEQNVQKMIDYLNEHGQEDVHCNIIIGGSAIYHNHTEVWNMKIPTYVSKREIQQYMDDVYDKIIINNYPISTTDELHEVNNNKDSRYYHNLGFKYRNTEKGVKYFKKAIDIDPNFSIALEQLGYTLEELGRYKEAIKYLERAKDLESEDYKGIISQHIEDCRIKLKESETSSIIKDLDKGNKARNELKEVNNSQRLSNNPRKLNINEAPKTEMNSTLKHIVDEFKICPDINIVSVKIGIPAKKIKKWYNRKDGEYKLFHDAIADLNPNMKIEHINTLNSVPIDSRLNSAPADAQLKSTAEDLYELNRKQREINLKKYNDKKVKKFY